MSRTIHPERTEGPPSTAPSGRKIGHSPHPEDESSGSMPLPFQGTTPKPISVSPYFPRKRQDCEVLAIKTPVSKLKQTEAHCSIPKYGEKWIEKIEKAHPEKLKPIFDECRKSQQHIQRTIEALCDNKDYCANSLASLITSRMSGFDIARTVSARCL